MVRKPMILLALGLLLGAQTLFAQDEQAQKPLRFEAFVKVSEFSQDGKQGVGDMTVLRPGEETPVQALPYKAYPYGSTFTLAAGTKARVAFADLSYMVVRGPAKFVPTSNQDWTAIVLTVTTGDYNLAIDDRAQAGQFKLVTPLGTFESLAGRSRLHVGALASTTGEDFSYRVLSGTANFQGLHYSASELSQANAFVSSDVSTMQSTELVGRSGEVKLALPSGNGKSTPFSLTPGATVKITRAKARASDNWAVSVLTLYPNGEAKNYFAYVEGRGEGFSTGELIDEVLPAEEEAEEGEGEEGDASGGEAADDLDDFGDDDLL